MAQKILCTEAFRTNYKSKEARCTRCNGLRFVEEEGFKTCMDCGRVNGSQAMVTKDGKGHEISDSIGVAIAARNSPAYQRKFYFNERCSRWSCNEPSIPKDLMKLIKREAFSKDSQGQPKYPEVKTKCNRKLINKILGNVDLPKRMVKKHRSKKFRKTLFTNKRLYDKFSEKWKTIRWHLTGIKPLFPSPGLVEFMKRFFCQIQLVWEQVRHDPACNGRAGCEKYFNCLHNFIHYDYIFRWGLQRAERTGYTGAFDLFKEEFPLPSKKVVETKLRPIRDKMCKKNGWEIPQYD